MDFITLDANMEKSRREREALANFWSVPVEEQAKFRKELFDATPSGFGASDFTQVKLSEGKFIDLNIHLESFLDDIAIRTESDAEIPIFWKTRSSGVLGMTTGSLYGDAPQHLFLVNDNYEQVKPVPFETPEVRVPNVALTQDPAKLGLRQIADMRHAESLRLMAERFLVNILTYQPFSTTVGQSLVNYANLTVNPYNGKQVYVVDPYVQTGTYDTTNIINDVTEGGLTFKVLYDLITQCILSGRQLRTLHVPKRGLPWRELVKFATVVANANVFGPGARTNPNLNNIPTETWNKVFNMDQLSPLNGSYMIVDIFGMTFKIKANNVLPQGVAIATTSEPALEVINFTGLEHNLDLDEVDPKHPSFSKRFSRRTWGFAQPDPWARNWFAVVFDTPATV